MEVSVNTTNLKNAASQIYGSKKSIGSAADTIRAAATALDAQFGTYAHVSAVLRKCSYTADRLANGAGKLGKGAVQIAGLYDAADGNITTEVKEAAKNGVGSGDISDFGKWSWKSGEVEYSDGIYSAAMAGSILDAELDAKVKSSFDIDEGELGVDAEAGASLTLLHGEVAASIGLLNTTGKVDVGKVGAKGEIGASLMKEGKFDPSLKAKASAEAKGIEGEIEDSFGTDEYNIHAGAKGDLGYAGAEAGIEIEKDGFKAEAGAEAYLAKGELSGGFTLFGIKVDASVEGKAGGAGVGCKADVGKNSASGYLGIGLLVGAGIKIDVDWTNFSLPW